MTPNELLKKAERAAESAQILLTSGDFDGACNRAYYAMFDAARATLLLKNSIIALETIKTHKGLISAFGLHIVKKGLISVELGKILNRQKTFVLLRIIPGI